MSIQPSSGNTPQISPVTPIRKSITPSLRRRSASKNLQIVFDTHLEKTGSSTLKKEKEENFGQDSVSKQSNSIRSLQEERYPPETYQRTPHEFENDDTRRQPESTPFSQEERSSPRTYQRTPHEFENEDTRRQTESNRFSPEERSSPRTYQRTPHEFENDGTRRQTELNGFSQEGGCFTEAYDQTPSPERYDQTPPPETYKQSPTELGMNNAEVQLSRTIPTKTIQNQFRPMQGSPKLRATFGQSLRKDGFAIIHAERVFREVALQTEQSSITPEEKNLIDAKISEIRSINSNNKLSEDDIVALKKLLFISLRTKDVLEGREIKIKPRDFGLTIGFSRSGDLVHFNFNKDKNIGNGFFKQAKYSISLNLESMQVYPSVYIKPKKQNKGAVQEILKEIEMQKLCCQHKNIVAVLSVMNFFDKSFEDKLKVHLKGGQDGEKIAVYFDCCDGGTLENVINNKYKYSFKDLVSLMCGYAAGLEHMHSLNVFHLDIKPDNLLIQMDGLKQVPKIADFGLASFPIDAKGRPVILEKCCTRTRAPEVHINWDGKGEPIYVAASMDIFHFGLCLYQVFHEKYPLTDGFTSDRVPDLKKIEKEFENWPINGEESKVLKQLTKACLSPNPKQRPTMKDVKQRLDALEKSFGK